MLVFKYCWNCLRLSQWLVVTRGEYSIDSRLSSAHINGAEQCYCSAHRVISALPSWRCSCASGGGLSMNEKNRGKMISVSDDGGLMVITLQRYCWLWLYRRWWCQRQQQLFHHSATWRSWIAGQLTSRLATRLYVVPSPEAESWIFSRANFVFLFIDRASVLPFTVFRSSPYRSLWQCSGDSCRAALLPLR